MARKLLAEDDGFELSVSATTRSPRPGETHGKDYQFLSEAEFLDMIEDGAFLEHAEVFGNRYGTPILPVERALSDGKDMLFDVDWQGGQQMRASTLRDAMVSVFLLPPSVAELEVRLHGRAQDSEMVIAGRMAKTRSEISHWEEYDYVLINDDPVLCYSQIKTIVNAERLRRRHRMPGLMPMIDQLNAEFEARKEKK